ncbi:MAG: hypothetical protein ACKVK0_17990, partial [Pirellulales bacterium]
MKLWSKLTLLMLSIAAMAVVACSGGDAVEPEIVIQTVIVTEKGETVTETVTETVVVEKEGATVVVTATPVLPATATPVPADKPAPPSKNASGQLVWSTIADSGIGSGFNAGNLCCGAKMMSVVETLFKPTHAGGPATPLLAESWELDSTNSPPLYVDVTIKSGIMFHGGYGELTADDLV